MKPDDAQLLELSGRRAAGIARTRRSQDARVLPAELGLEGRLMRRLLGSLGDPPLRVTLWNGESIFTGRGNAVAGIRIADRSALLKLFINPELYFGEAYGDGSIEVDGDLVKLLEVACRGMEHASFSGTLRHLVKSLDRPRSNALSAARDNIHHHYDLGNEFYRLWLDREMLYTCAYFPTPDVSLEQAQVAKMDHVCRKLRLRPGDAVVEAGCGWGALALHMATRYGAQVRAFNISREQIAYARARARAMGVGQRVEFMEDDYRNISGRYDAFVSVGMLEHVGRDHYGELGRVIDRCLPRNGRGILHSIGQDQPALLNAWIEKRIFPGAYPPTLREMLAILEPQELSVLDVENLRLHYALTLEHWLRRFEDARERVSEMYDERFVRTWRLYLAGSLAAFNTGNLQLFQ
ncbi:MAG: class I SAM-dependent methyltransferase, partial [Betaproteobacteria bacterium]|nr:class I SAM-dependent methyltransferase [Betaproteobacteria bacterium]